MSAETVLKKMERLHTLPWKEQQEVLKARAKLVRVHSKPEYQQTGAILKFSNGRRYQRQSDGSLKRLV